MELDRCPTHPDRPALPGRPWCRTCLRAQRRGQRAWTPQPHDVTALLMALAGPLWAQLTAQEQLWVDAMRAKAQRAGGLDEAYAQLVAHLHAKAQGQQAVAAASLQGSSEQGRGKGVTREREGSVMRGLKDDQKLGRRRRGGTME